MKRIVLTLGVALLLPAVAVAGDRTLPSSLRGIVVPLPDGFVATSSDYPKTFRAMADSANDQDAAMPSRLVELFVPRDQAAAIESGALADADRFMTEFEYQNDHSDRYSERDFSRVAANLHEGEKLLTTDDEFDAYLSKAPDLLGPQGKLARSTRGTGVIDVGILLDRPHALAVAKVLTVTAKGFRQTEIIVTLWTLLRGHLISLNILTKVETPDDIRWARSEASKWADLTLAANP